jgi:hypothetical protein
VIKEAEEDNGTVIGAQKLRDGSIIIEMDTNIAAQDLRARPISSILARSFGDNATIKQPTYPVVLDHVPTTYDTDSWRYKAAMRDLEHINNLPERSIKDTRWIKPVKQRASTQTTASLIVTFDSANMANKIIRHGLIIEYKRVHARKPQIQPRRCFKCHKIGVSHLASTCPQKHDTCGKCSAEHKTSECNISDQEQLRCPVCEMTGHVASDSDCPKLRD